MTKQLERIIQHFGTNELLRTNTQNKTMNRFIMKINQLIRLYKKDQQKTEQREKKLKQEMTNISHDLRTPLTSLKGFSELLTDPKLSEAERNEFLHIVQRKIDHLTKTADLFYELSQINSLEHELNLEQLSLEQIVIETILMFYNEFEKRELTIYIDEKTVTPILADQKATERIIINIIQNALRYAKSYFSIDFVAEDEYVQLRAKNDVSEFDQTEVKRIFDRTYRVETSRTGDQLGLGLHIVQELIIKQGGKVAVDVQDNEFTINVYFRKIHSVDKC